MPFRPSTASSAPLLFTIDDLELDGDGTPQALGTITLAAHLVGHPVIVTTYLAFESTANITDQELIMDPAGTPFPNTGPAIGWTGLGTDSVGFFAAHPVTWEEGTIEISASATSEDGSKVTAQIAITVEPADTGTVDPPVREPIDLAYETILTVLDGTPPFSFDLDVQNPPVSGRFKWLTEVPVDPVDPTTITDWSDGVPPEGCVGGYFETTFATVLSGYQDFTLYAYIAWETFPPDVPVNGLAWGTETAGTGEPGWFETAYTVVTPS